jgi:predicted DNA-binding transcriptional regulator AlpA
VVKEIVVQKNEGLADIKQAISFASVCRSTWLNGVKKGIYPAAVRLGARRIAWRWSDLYDWAENLPKVEAL